MICGGADFWIETSTGPALEEDDELPHWFAFCQRHRSLMHGPPLSRQIWELNA